ncbi:MAG: translation initiation factor 2 [Desulfovibrio sp.]|nr:translation initiation factor 2 [Desulfovibrio sp.]
MNKYVVSACLSLFLVSGCASTSVSENAQDVQPAVQAQENEAPKAPVEEPKASSKKGKQKTEKQASSKHHKSEATIREELKVAGGNLVSRASRTITPSKSNKSVKQSSNGYVASYVSIDPANYSTEMRPGAQAGHYVGFVRYSEQIYQCAGKTKKEALAAPCNVVNSRRVNEMIRYDGAKWNY